MSRHRDQKQSRRPGPRDGLERQAFDSRGPIAVGESAFGDGGQMRAHRAAIEKTRLERVVDRGGAASADRALAGEPRRDERVSDLGRGVTNSRGRTFDQRLDVEAGLAKDFVNPRAIADARQSSERHDDRYARRLDDAATRVLVRNSPDQQDLMSKRCARGRSAWTQDPRPVAFDVRAQLVVSVASKATSLRDPTRLVGGCLREFGPADTSFEADPSMLVVSRVEGRALRASLWVRLVRGPSDDQPRDRALFVVAKWIGRADVGSRPRDSILQPIENSRLAGA